MSASNAELDMYNELTNIGAGNAATALSQMLNERVDIGLPQAIELSLGDLEGIVGGSDSGAVTMVLINVRGELAGSIALVLDPPDHYLEALQVPEEFADSALGEIGNIFGAQFLIAMGRMANLTGEVEPPAVGHGPRNAILETVIALAAESEPFYVLQMALKMGDHESEAQLLYFPAEQTLDNLRELLQ